MSRYELVCLQMCALLISHWFDVTHNSHCRLHGKKVDVFKASRFALLERIEFIENYVSRTSASFVAVDAFQQLKSDMLVQLKDI